MAEKSQKSWVRPAIILAAAVAGALFIAAIIFWHDRCRKRLPEQKQPASTTLTEQDPTDPELIYRRIPISKLPGPGRTFGPCSFILDEANSQIMQGIDDPVNERLCDVAGNFYASTFIASFSYANPGSNGPIVRIKIDPEGDTLRGRLEARGLKPNFVYQIKLSGVYSDRRAFDAIGYAGRWRLPGRATNYGDYNYRAYPFKEAVEAYILFDFFMTNGDGDATRNFALDSTLHVLWNASRQGGGALADDMVPLVVDAGRADRYIRPRQTRTLEMIWAERETIRYTEADEVIRLPEGPYSAELILTEESFHSPYNDGGYWATVYKSPISFIVTSPPVLDN